MNVAYARIKYPIEDYYVMQGSINKYETSQLVGFSVVMKIYKNHL